MYFAENKHITFKINITVEFDLYNWPNYAASSFGLRPRATPASSEASPGPVSPIIRGRERCRATATSRPPCASTPSATSPSTWSCATCRRSDAATNSPISSGRTAQWRSASPWMPRIVIPTPTSSSSSSQRSATPGLQRGSSMSPCFLATGCRPEGTSQYSLAQGSSNGNHHQMNSNKRDYVKTIHASHIEDPRFSHVPSNQDTRIIFHLSR